MATLECDMTEDRAESCPVASALALYCAGRLPNSEHQLIEDHVERCTGCLDWVQRHLSNDDIAENLRLADPLEEYRKEPAFASSLVGAIASGLSTDRVAGDSRDSMDLSRGISDGPRLNLAPVERPLPSRLGDYTIIERIGKGATGTVYRAKDHNLACEVAVKVLHPQQLLDETVVARFGHERAAIGRVDHPNVVGARTAGESEGVHYLVMDLVTGVDLTRLLKDRGGVLPVEEACGIARQIALGLQGIHEAGLLHRDIKPSNVMLNDRGVAKILDLGLAHLRSAAASIESASLTVTHALIGTVDYMSPEQAHDPRHIDIRSDLYSLSCTLFELLTGRPPFAGEKYGSLASKLRAHHGDKPPSIRELRAEVPNDLADVIGQLLEKSPTDRLQTPAEVARALAHFTGGPIEALQPLRRSKTSRRRFAAQMLTAATSAGVIGFCVRALTEGQDAVAPVVPPPVTPASQGPAWFRNLKVRDVPASTYPCGIVWDDALKVASITPVSRNLITAGELTAKRFIISLRLAFPTEQEFGVFLGLRQVDLNGRPMLSFQALRMSRKSTAHEYEFLRSMYYLSLSPDSNPTTHFGESGAVRLAKTGIAFPERGQHHLELEVLDDRFERATWDKQPLAEITNKAGYVASEFRGEWGIFASKPLRVLEIRTTSVLE